MKKNIIFLLFLLFTISLFLPNGKVFATIDQTLYYGLKQNNEVRKLQQFLIDKGFLTGSPTGNFFTLTLNAVKKYQASKKIITTGRVAFLTRRAINEDLSSGKNTNTTTATTNTTTAITASVPLTGSLDLLQNTEYASQKSTIPQIKFKLAEFKLTNNTTEAINLNKVQVDLAVGSSLYVSNLYLNNLYIDYGQNKTNVLYNVSHNNYLSINYQIARGQTVILSLFADVNSSLPLDSTISPSLLISGVSAVSTTTVTTNANSVLNGQVTTFGKGFLTVGLDSLTPLSKIYATTQNIIAGRFQFTATSEPYNILNLKFAVPSSYAAMAIRNAVLSDAENNTVLSSEKNVIYDGSYYLLDFNVNVPVAANSSKSIVISYNLFSASNPSGASTNIAPMLVYVKAENSKKTFVDGLASNYSNTSFKSFYGGITIPGAGVEANKMYIFKSVPTFTASQPNKTGKNNSNIDLYTFNIAADPKGDVSVKQLVFEITVADSNRHNCYLNKFKFLKGDIDYTNFVAIATTVNNNFIDLTNNNVGTGTTRVIVTFNDEETILAGKNQTYTLRAFANNFIESSVSTMIPADETASTNGSYLRMVFTKIYGLAKSSTDIFVVNYNLLWSDKSAVYPVHDATNGFSTNDWYNGFKVLNLPLSAQTVSAQ